MIKKSTLEHMAKGFIGCALIMGTLVGSAVLYKNHLVESGKLEQKYEERFKEMDKNSDGVIDYQEFTGRHNSYQPSNN